MADFTPGPWVVFNGVDIFTTERHGKENDGHQIADCYVDYSSADDCGIDMGKAEANAHLIAAAPDMYEALEALLYEQNDAPLLKREKEWNKAVSLAEAALAKAKEGK